MTMFDDARSRIALAIAAITFSGCAVGSAYVSAPDRLPSKTLPSLTVPISFDVCVKPNPRLPRPHIDERRRVALGDRVRKVLSRAGVPAELTAAAGSPVDVTVTLRDDWGPMWSVGVSFLTFAVVPGYAVERKTLDVDLVWRDPAEVEEIEHLQYQSRTNLFVWLPLVISPDFIFDVTSGWESPKAEDAGFTQMVERLGDDIRARRGRDSAEALTPGRRGVACPPAVTGSALAETAATDRPLGVHLTSLRDARP